MAAMHTPGTHVWFAEQQGHILRAGRVVESSGSSVVVAPLASGKAKGGDVGVVNVNTANVRQMHPSSAKEGGVDNMVALGDLHVGAILHNLVVRFERDEIYTYTGPILIAVNPFKELPLYTNDYVSKYHGTRLGELPPHIFAIADESYYRLLRDHLNQCVVISGESGAGKTESTKLILNYLAHLSGKHSQIEEQLIESSPILEAFGNAKTVRNNNSSRFGKFMEIQFSTEGHIEGARIHDYLLEKSRIVAQAENERNYHIFFNLLAGASAEEKSALRLKDPANYRLVSQSGCLQVAGMSDADDYERVKSAMENLSMSDQLVKDIMRLVAAVLHLGNIDFTPTSEDACKVNESNGALDDAAAALGVQAKALAHSLVNRVNKTAKETITAQLNRDKAIESRDALTKAIYGALFSYIVATLNKVITSPRASGLFIGVLDIFGFEDFKVNSFEQLCINYANERLQQFFNQHIFKMEQEEYDKEGINWSKIDFVDNQPCLDLISKKPVGILLILDEECAFPRASDQTMLDKLNSNHAGKTPHGSFVKPKLAKGAFGVVHYAGTVTYDITNFLDKNRDRLRDDLEGLMFSSTANPLLKEVFHTQKLASTVDSPSTPTLLSPTHSPANSIGRSITPPPQTGAATPHKTSLTVGARFHDSLTSLIGTLTSCHPFFVRCIKPNSLQAADTLQPELVEAQLRYSGLLETVRIRKAGYSLRMEFSLFWSRYRYLLPPTLSGAKVNDKCRDVLESLGVDDAENWQLGHSKVFMRESVELGLERLRHAKLGVIAVTLQRIVRGFLARRWYSSRRQAIVRIQSVYRGYRLRRDLEKQEDACTKIQSVYRGHVVRKEYRRLREQARRLKEEQLRLQAEAKKALDEERKRQAQAKADEERKKSEKERVAAQEELNWQQAAALAKQEELKRQAEAVKQKREEIITSLSRSGTMDNIAAAMAAERQAMAAEAAVAAAAAKAAAAVNTAVAKEDYDNGGRDILSFQYLDVIEILERNDETGWWYGKCRGQKGWFPSELVELNSTPGQATADVSRSRTVGRTLRRKKSQKAVAAKLPDRSETADDILTQKYSMLNFARQYFRDCQDLRRPTSPPSNSTSPVGSISAAVASAKDRGSHSRSRSSSLTSKISGMFKGTLRGGSSSGSGSRPSSPSVAMPVMTDGESASTSSDFREVVKLIKFSKTPIKSSLLPVSSDDDNQVALDMFNVVMQFMGDIATKQEPGDLAHWLLAKCVQRPTMCDELLCQIIKQTTSNTNHKGASTVKGWRLLELCLGCFPCSSVMEPYLRKHVQFYSQQKGNDLYELAMRCEHKMQMIKRNGPRVHAPLYDEIKLILANKLFIRITFPDETQKPMEVWPCTTAKDVVLTVCRRLELKSTEQYALFSESHNHTFILKDDVYILDRITQHQRDHEALSKTREMGQFDCHILFRKYIWTRNEIDANSSQQLVHLGLHQTVTNIYNDHFPAAPELTAEIASLLFRETEGADIQANMGTNTHSLSPKAKEVAYKPYVPDHLWTQKSPAEWVHLIDGAAKNHKGQSIPDWTCDLVKRLQTSDLFGANFYLLVNPKFDKLALPAQVLLAISSDGLRFLQTHTKEVLAYVAHGELASWNHSADVFTAKLDGMVQRNQRVVKGCTSRGMEICSIISDYVKLVAVAEHNASKANR